MVQAEVSWSAAAKYHGDNLCTIGSEYRPLGEYQVMRNGFDNQNGEITIKPNGVVGYESNNGSADYGRVSFCYIAAS